MRDLNEIITRNALKFFAEAIEAAAKEGRELTQHKIAGRMAEAMGMKQDSVRKQLERILAGDADWTGPYMGGLASAVGKTPQEIVSLDPKSESVSEATVAQMLYTSLNHRLALKEVRAVIRRLHRQLDHRPLFVLCQALTDGVLNAHGKAEAYETVHELVKKSEAWDTKRADLRGKRLLDK